ncbi:MAG: hypothetical protein AAGJ91_07355 [Pseudomonadota bacterium]
MPQTLTLLLAPTLLLAACVATTPPGRNGGTEQLRASLDDDLSRAGVSDTCIAELDLSTLAQVKTFTDPSPRSSLDVLKQRQQIRTAVSRTCPNL